VLLLCSATAALAQDDIGYESGIHSFGMLFHTIVWFIIYLVIYALALPIGLTTLGLFRGFESEFIYWVLLLWGGGMGIDYLVYHMTGPKHNILASLLALPLLFGWTLFISTRSFADLMFQSAVRIALIVALVGAPWMGPTWRMQMITDTSKDGSMRPAVIAPRLRTVALPTLQVTSREDVFRDG
jgi:hypothetical protein